MPTEVAEGFWAREHVHDELWTLKTSVQQGI